MGEFKIECREDVIRFMQEMMTKFSEDHVSDLMENRRVEECEELVGEYIKDERFTAVAEYLINEGGIDATVEDFKTDEPLMNIMMFFHCFEDYYGNNSFTELYIFSEEEYIAYVKSLAESDVDVAKETATLLLGLEDIDDLEDYDYGEYDAYDNDYWHLTELTIPELIDFEDPYERCCEKDEDEAEEGDNASEENEDEAEEADGASEEAKEEAE